MSVNLPNLVWNWSSLSTGTYSWTYQVRVDPFVQEGTVLNNCAQLTYDGLSAPKISCQVATLATLYTVSVAVYDEAGELVKKIWTQLLSQPVNSYVLQNNTLTNLEVQTDVVASGVTIAAWDGTNQAGDPVSNGAYYLKVENIDSKGVVTSGIQTVVVSRAIAKIQMNVYNAVGELVRHLFNYTDDPNNASLSDIKLSSSTLLASVSGGNAVTITTAPVPLNMSWDGRSDSGAMVTSGHYMIAVNWTNGTGVETSISRGILVQTGNSAPVSLWAQPNILKGGMTTTTIFAQTSVPSTLKVRLYDVAGELVKTYQGVAGTNQVALDVTGLASGYYLALVDLLDANGNFNARQATHIAVLR